MKQVADKTWSTAAELNAVSRNTIMEVLGIQVDDFSEQQIVLSMPISDASRQPYGLLHGGVNMVLAETAASYHACWGIDLNKKLPVGIEINGSHLNSADKGTVRATAIVLRRSASLIVHDVEIIHVETERVLCVSRVTNFYKTLKQA